jgi:hypothetical protein
LLIAVAAITVSMAGFYMLGGGYSVTTQRWFVRTFGDVMDWKSRWIAGKGALNCGTVGIGSNADAATSCALQAFATHRAFRVRYTLKTFDVDMAAGLVGTKNGRIYEIVFWGGESIGTDVIRQRAFLNSCPVPMLLRRTQRGRVTCFPSAPETPRNWTSSWLSDAP